MESLIRLVTANWQRLVGWLVIGGAAVAALGVVGPNFVQADGWHNAALATSSLDQWMAQVKQSMPKVELSQKPAAKDGSSTLRAGAGAAGLREALSRAGQPAADDSVKPANGQGPVRGGSLQASMTPQEQALMARQVAQCLEILAYMDPKNIFPREFPSFQMQQIPAYRQAAKGVLAATGDVGSQAVVAQIRSHLTGAFQQQQRDVSLSNQYAKDLLDLLGNAFDQGNVSVDEVASLREATVGNKPPELAAFAKAVRDLIEKKAGSLPSLLDWYGESRAALDKTKLRNQIEKAITESPSADLVTALGHEAVDPFRITILRRLANDLPKLNEADLLEMLASDLDDRLLALVEQELARRSPTYADVQTMIEDFARHARSPDEGVARYARAQLVNAFLRAPITQCLKWLGQGDEPLNAIIWKQIDVRIARADADRKADYLSRAMAVLKADSVDESIRVQAIHLIGRLGEKSAARDVVEFLPSMPASFFGPTGRMLKELTGQDFGPMTGDGLAAAIVAARKWRMWLDSQGL